MDLQQPSQPTAQILQALCFWASINLSLQGHWPAILISQNTESCGHILPRLSNSKKRGRSPSSRSPKHSPLHLLKARTGSALPIQLREWAHQIKADWCPHTRVWSGPTGNNTKQNNKECLSWWDFQCYFTSLGRSNHSNKPTKAELMAECSPLSFSALLLLCCGALRKTLKVRFLVIPASVCISVK